MKAIQDNAALKRLELTVMKNNGPVKFAYLINQVHFLSSIEQLSHKFDKFLPQVVSNWLSIDSKVNVYVYQMTSNWQRFLAFLFKSSGSDYEFAIPAKEFACIVDVCQNIFLR